ncbi:TPA: hypothetical protein JL171_005347, partial [Escherichia coli]|nr:hypothetical protein [Escherichia coli]
AAAVSSWSGGAGGYRSLYADQNTGSFYGGLGKKPGAILHYQGARDLIGALSSDFLAKWKEQGSFTSAGVELFDASNTTYFGAYGAGIKKGR